MIAGDVEAVVVVATVVDAPAAAAAVGLPVGIFRLPYHLALFSSVDPVPHNTQPNHSILYAGINICE